MCHQALSPGPTRPGHEAGNDREPATARRENDIGD
jgi:hypothetical protein